MVVIEFTQRSRKYCQSSVCFQIQMSPSLLPYLFSLPIPNNLLISICGHEAISYLQTCFVKAVTLQFLVRYQETWYSKGTHYKKLDTSIPKGTHYGSPHIRSSTWYVITWALGLARNSLDLVSRAGTSPVQRGRVRTGSGASLESFSTSAVTLTPLTPCRPTSVYWKYNERRRLIWHSHK